MSKPWPPNEAWVPWRSVTKQAGPWVHLHIKTPDGSTSVAMSPVQAREAAALLLDCAEQAGKVLAARSEVPDGRFGYNAACMACGEKTTCYLASPDWTCVRCGGRVKAASVFEEVSK